MGIKSNGGLDRMIGILGRLESTNWAEVAAPAMDAYMRQQLAAGNTPEGEPWVQTKKGARALKGAASAFKLFTTGQAVVMKVGGGATSRYAFHHFGAQLKPARRQLPRGKLPGRLGDAIRAGCGLQFKAITKAGKRGAAYYAKRAAKGGKAK